MFAHLRPGDSTRVTVVDGDVADLVEIRHVRRVAVADLLAAVRRDAQPPVHTDGLPQRCRWFGQSATDRVYVFEMPPRLVTWRFQLHLDEHGRVAVPVALPYQVYVLALAHDGRYLGGQIFWSRRPLPVGSEIYKHELRQYAAPNIRIGSGVFCLGGTGPGQLSALVGPEAMLFELHRGLGEDLASEHMAHDEILNCMPPEVRAATPSPEETELFGLPTEEWPRRIACMRYARQLGLWTRAQADPLVAVCELDWPVLSTVRNVLKPLLPGILA